jgi:hypothetical protein
MLDRVATAVLYSGGCLTVWYVAGGQTPLFLASLHEEGVWCQPLGHPGIASRS